MGGDVLSQPLRNLRPEGSRDLATQQVGTGAQALPSSRSQGSKADPGGMDPRSHWAPQQPPKDLAQGARRLLRPAPLGLKAFVSVSNPLVWTEVASHSLLGSGLGDAVGMPLPAYSSWTPVGKCTQQGRGSGICLVTEPFADLVMVVGPFSGKWAAWAPGSVSPASGTALSA